MKNEKWLIVILGALLLAILATGCGQQGNMGLPGPAGAPGAPGTVVDIVQFCPTQGATTHNHFPEQGVCINGHLIAAFWDGANAFLAEVVPGAYISTSTGLQCSFTVTTNCNIQ